MELLSCVPVEYRIGCWCRKKVWHYALSLSFHLWNQPDIESMPLCNFKWWWIMSYFCSSMHCSTSLKFDHVLVLLEGPQCSHLVVLIFLSYVYALIARRASFSAWRQLVYSRLSSLIYCMFEFHVILTFLAWVGFMLSQQIPLFSKFQGSWWRTSVRLVFIFLFQRRRLYFVSSYYQSKSPVTTNYSWVQHIKGIKFI